MIWGEEKCEIKCRRLMKMPFSVADEWFVEYREGWHGVYWTVTTKQPHLTVSALDLQDLIPRLSHGKPLDSVRLKCLRQCDFLHLATCSWMQRPNLSTRILIK